jgi:hypothetical protein
MAEGDQDNGRDVMSSLPSRRPQRRTARRDAAAKGTATRPKKPAANASARPKAARPRPKTASAPRKPAGVRPSAATDAAASKPDQRPAQAPEGIELVGTAIQAAGELAQLGLTLGTKALRGAVRRIPRP